MTHKVPLLAKLLHVLLDIWQGKDDVTPTTLVENIKYSLQTILLVSISPAPAQAQPLGQAKVAIISAYSFLFFTNQKLKEAFLSELFKTKVRKGTKLGYQKTRTIPKMCARSDWAKKKLVA